MCWDLSEAASEIKPLDFESGKYKESHTEWFIAVYQTSSSR